LSSILCLCDAFTTLNEGALALLRPNCGEPSNILKISHWLSDAFRLKQADFVFTTGWQTAIFYLVASHGLISNFYASMVITRGSARRHATEK